MFALRRGLSGRRFFAAATKYSAHSSSGYGIIRVQGPSEIIDPSKPEAPPFLPQSSTFAYDYRPMSVNPDNLGKFHCGAKLLPAATQFLIPFAQMRAALTAKILRVKLKSAITR